MVSIRRRRLLGLYSGIHGHLAGQKSVLGPISISIDGDSLKIYEDNMKPVSIHPINDGYIQKHVSGATVAGLETMAGSPESNSTKQDKVSKLKALKHRRQHRRRHSENREPCTMRGVYYKNRKWQAAIKVDKKQIHLGTVDSEEEAARLYDRAAFMCGREPNLELSEEEKNELRKYKWDEFLALTRSTIASKRLRGNVKRYNQMDEKSRFIGFSASEDEILAS